MKEAQKAVIAAMGEDIASEFGPMLAPYGFVNISHGFDKTWELVQTSFKDPVRKDEIVITVDCDSHKFSATYFVSGQDYEEDELDTCSLKTFQKKLVKWLEGLGWECPVCEGDGTVWPDEPDTDEDYKNETDDETSDDTIPVDEQLLPCPYCGGSGKTRQPIDKEKAA